jgi:hypothetical protein
MDYLSNTQKNGAVSKVDKKCISHPIRARQRELSMFLMHYHQFDSHAYCGAVGPVSKMASQQEKAFRVFRFEVSRSVIKSEACFVYGLRKYAPRKNNIFLKPCTKPTLHCNRRSGHLKTEHSKRLLLLRRHPGNWFYGPEISMRSELLVEETWTASAADSVCCARVGCEINYLTTFEIALIFCVCPVYNPKVTICHVCIANCILKLLLTELRLYDLRRKLKQFLRGSQKFYLIY